VAAIAVTLVVARPDVQTGPAGDRVQIHLTGGAHAADVMRERVVRAGVQNVDVTVAGDEVTLSAPPELQATVAALAVPGRFAIYDWETSVVGPNGPAPGDTAVTGGKNAGYGGALSLHDARERAAGSPGCVVVRTERDPNRAYVLTGSPALTSADLASARAGRDPQLNEPIVLLQFTQDGIAAFSRLTRDAAHRGAAQRANQHIALVVDDRILSTPFIDYRQVPDGIDGSRGGQISSELTPTDARILAAVVSTGPLR
jgi:hypothetical protein